MYIAIVKELNLEILGLNDRGTVKYCILTSIFSNTSIIQFRTLSLSD